jgi:hypothetical protein
VPFERERGRNRGRKVRHDRCWDSFDPYTEVFMFEKRVLEADDILGAIGLRRRGAAAEAWYIAGGLVAVGAVAGAAIAVLATPRSGKDLRGEIRGRAHELSDRFMRTARDFRGTAEDMEEELGAKGRKSAREFRATGQ